MKNFFAFCLVLTFLALPLFAQEQANASLPKNTVVFGYTGPVLGYNLAYERRIGERFALSLEMFGSIDWTTEEDDSYRVRSLHFGVLPRVRYYAWRGLFADVGAGYGDAAVFDAKPHGDGLALSAGMGYRFDFSSPGGFVIVPSVALEAIPQLPSLYGRFNLSFGFSW
jgi:hypothetical protein